MRELGEGVLTRRKLRERALTRLELGEVERSRGWSSEKGCTHEVGLGKKVLTRRGLRSGAVTKSLKQA